MLRIFNQYYPLRNILFVLTESVLIFFSVIAAVCFSFENDFLSVANSEFIIYKVFLIAVVCQVSMYYCDLYDFKITNSNAELGIRLLQSLGMSSIVLAVIYFVFPFFIIMKGTFLVTLFFLTVSIVSWRVLYNWILKTNRFTQRILIVGSGSLAREITMEILEKKDSGFQVIGFLDDDPEKVGVCILNPEVIGTFDQLLFVVEKEKVDKVIVAIPERRGKMPIKELLLCRIKGVDIEEGITFYERLTGKVAVENIYPSWLIFSEGFNSVSIFRILKRIFDLVFSSLGLALFSPAMLIIGLLIKIDSYGPVFFRQIRVGKDGKAYSLIKFRSMKYDAESDTGPVWAKTNDDRVTRVGKAMRKARIDEVPQLFNVLKGDMSIVGPRPERPFFVKTLEKKIPHYAQRFCVKPGITGWAQIRYSYGASVEDSQKKLQFDLYYIQNMSLFLDLFIMFESIKVVLFGKGAR